MAKSQGFRVVAFVLLPVIASGAFAARRKGHSVVLGALKGAPYLLTGDPAVAAAGEVALKIRAPLVDGVLKEWTTGDAHDVTERTFVVRRLIRLNDELPGDKQGQWVWQRGPSLPVDRVTRRVTALKLPDYNPGVSQIAWFRDYRAIAVLRPAAKASTQSWRKLPRASRC